MTNSNFLWMAISAILIVLIVFIVSKKLESINWLYVIIFGVLLIPTIVIFNQANKENFLRSCVNDCVDGKIPNRCLNEPNLLCDGTFCRNKVCLSDKGCEESKVFTICVKNPNDPTNIYGQCQAPETDPCTKNKDLGFCTAYDGKLGNCTNGGCVPLPL